MFPMCLCHVRQLFLTNANSQSVWRWRQLQGAAETLRSHLSPPVFLFCLSFFHSSFWRTNVISSQLLHFFFFFFTCLLSHLLAVGAVGQPLTDGRCRVMCRRRRVRRPPHPSSPHLTPPTADTAAWSVDVMLISSSWRLKQPLPRPARCFPNLFSNSNSKSNVNKSHSSFVHGTSFVRTFFCTFCSDFL